MNRLRTSLIALLSLPAVAFADFCADIAQPFNDALRDGYESTVEALRLTTDPLQQNAIRMAWEGPDGMKFRLILQRDQALMSANCLPDTYVPEPLPAEPQPVPPPEPPPIGGGGGSSNPPSSTEPPATEPPATEPPATEPPATEPPAQTPPSDSSEPPSNQPPAGEPPANQPPAEEPPSGGEPPANQPPVEEPQPSEEPPTEEIPDDTGGDDEGDVDEQDPGTQSCLEQLHLYAQQLVAEGVRGSQFVHKMKAKIHELGCRVRNYGQWRRCWKKRHYRRHNDHKRKMGFQRCGMSHRHHSKCKR